jgi:hypothetical protein
MIRYDLECDREHGFDGWFSDSAAFDRQEAAGLVVCPVCGSARVSKRLMTPGLPVKANRREATQHLAAGPADAKTRALMEAVRRLRAHVEANADYVGERFPEEARRIHYNEVEPRGIYGEASAEEARALIEEGVDVHPLPRLPEDGN